MKSKNMKKVLAAALSTSMIMGMSITSLAATTPTSPETPAVNAPIYALDVIDVVVPTKFDVAFNPNELEVKTDSATSTTPTTAKILSRNFGIINKSSEHKIVTVELSVTDTNGKVHFVDSAADLATANKEDYSIYLEVAPAADTNISLKGTTATTPTQKTTGAALADIDMAKATTGTVPLKAGSNKIAFGLKKATYGLKDGETLILGDSNSQSNDVQSKFEAKNLATNGEGVTGFTFTGDMDSMAEWTKLSGSIDISAVYTSETTDTITPITGTGAAVPVAPPEVAPVFTAGDNAGVIVYTNGSGTIALQDITKIEMVNNGQTFDALPQATEEDGKITINSGFLSYFKVATAEAKIIYTTVGNVEKTATVNVKIR